MGSCFNYSWTNKAEAKILGVVDPIDIVEAERRLPGKLRIETLCILKTNP